MPSNAPPKTSANVTSATVSAVIANYSRAPLAGWPLPSVSCRPVGGHDDTQFYVSSDDCAMSALGQKQTCAVHQSMSALPPIATAKADSRERSCPLSTLPGSEQSSCGDKQNGNTLLYSRL